MSVMSRSLRMLSVIGAGLVVLLPVDARAGDHFFHKGQLIAVPATTTAVPAR